MDFKFQDNSKAELERFTTEVLDKIVGYSGTRRKQMYKKGHGITEPKDCFSITWGYTNLGYISPTKSREPVEGLKNTYKTKYRSDYPELGNIIQQLVDLHCPEPFTVDQLQINKNWWSPPHKDSGNVGESWIVGFGDYEGGATVVEYENEDVEYDIKYTFTKFDGSKYTHYTSPFDGKRYSIVFYNHKLSLKNKKN